MSDDPETQKMKHVEFYSATVNAWLNTRFEHDKSLLTLSAGAIGLLIALMPGVKSTEALILYIIALLCFLVCLGSILWIFKRNATYLENLVSGGSSQDNILKILDKIAAAAFMLGALLSSIIGISTAIKSYVGV